MDAALEGYFDLECNKLEELEREIDQRKNAYLRAKGWKHNSDTVGSYWMWFKAVTTPEYKLGEVVGEKTTQYGCAREDALRIQSTLDRREYERAHPEIYGD